jgi:hypothetical protein
LDLSAASEACSSALSLRSASSQWSSSWPFGRPWFSQSWWARSWTREVSSKARPFHRDDFRASLVTRERGFATIAALDVYTSVGPVRPTGGLPRCVAELRLYRSRRTARDGFAAIRMVNWSSARPKSGPACDDNGAGPSRSAKALKSASGAAAARSPRYCGASRLQGGGLTGHGKCRASANPGVHNPDGRSSSAAPG